LFNLFFSFKPSGLSLFSYLFFGQFSVRLVLFSLKDIVYFSMYCFFVFCFS